MEPHSFANSGELFSPLPVFLPQLTEGETLFSWAARYHRLSGNVLAQNSSIQLFGDRRAGLRPDFPSHLDRFVVITQGYVGDAETLAYERTIFGFFAVFQDAEGARKVFAQMRGGSVEKVKSALGLLPSRLGGFFPLKACSDCIKDDLRKYSVSRWHLEHQWPSVWVCRKHQKTLLALKRDYQPKDLRRWLLPEDVAQVEWDRYVVSDSVKSKLLQLAKCSIHIAQNRNSHRDGTLLRYTYLLRAKELDWLYTDGSLKLAQIRQDFLTYFQGLECLPGFDVVLTVRAEHGGILGLLMHQYDWRRHPVKHLLLITYLFKSTEAFDLTYERVRQTHAVGGTEALKGLVGEEWRGRLKFLVEVEHRSLSNAATIIGIPLCVAVRVAKQDGIAYQRRSRVANTALGDEIRKMILDGRTREEILQISGIRRTLLKDIMAREPDVRDAWRKNDLERRKMGYRVNFLKLLDQYKGVPYKILRTVPGNGVSWLYRNDRDWLALNLPRV